MLVRLIVTLIDAEAYEVSDAWDEYVIYANPEGYRAALKKVQRNSGVDKVRVMDVEVPDEAFPKLWEVPTVKGEPK